MWQQFLWPDPSRNGSSMQPGAKTELSQTVLPSTAMATSKASAWPGEEKSPQSHLHVEWYLASGEWKVTEGNWSDNCNTGQVLACSIAIQNDRISCLFMLYHKINAIWQYDAALCAVSWDPTAWKEMKAPEVKINIPMFTTSNKIN